MWFFMNVLVSIFFGVFSVSSTTDVPTNSSALEEETYKTNVCSGLSICNLTTVSPKTGLYKCMCDSKCAVYGDCCPESPHYNSSVQMNNTHKDMFLCPKQFGFYILNRCPSAFADNDVRRKCENVSLEQPDYGDVQTLKPVQDNISRITYLNAYCALCNGATNLESFELNYDCYEKQSWAKILSIDNRRGILLRAKFNPETKELKSIVNGTEYLCFHKVITPDHLKPYLRYCEPKMVSSCPRTFNDSKIADACRSLAYAVYTSPYIGEGDIYKNVHCANCNGIESVKLSPCQTLKHVSPYPTKHTEAASSSLFLIRQNGVCGEEDVDIPFC